VPDLPGAEGDLTAALDRLDGKTPYAEILAQSSQGNSLRIDRNQTTPTTLPCLRGAGIRAWCDDHWIAVTAKCLDPRFLQHAVDELSRQLSRRRTEAPPPGESPSGRGEAHTKPRRPTDEVPITEWTERARSWLGTARSIPGIDNAIVAISYQADERLFLSTTGCRRHQSVLRTHAGIAPLAMENGKVEYDYLSWGETGGWETLDYFTEDRIRETAEVARSLLHAATPPSGLQTVLLDPSTTGTVAHESFGHGTEADQFLRDRSYLRPLLGKEVGPEMLSIVDDGTAERGWGSFFFDDEGTPTHRTVLVDRGRFVEVLHDRETASVLHRHPTGNARCADFLSRAFVRMTNTLVEPGDWSLPELLEEAKDGVLLESCMSGMEDPLGGQMQIKVRRGHRIEGGKLGAPLSSMALSGKVLEFLGGVRGVGTAEHFSILPGFCGKGHTDILPAGTGGSYLLSRAVVGPG
jgi:TldD protein